MSAVKCSKCNQSIKKGDKFCPHCGTHVQHTVSKVYNCTKCNHENPEGLAYCENCGTPLKLKQANSTTTSEHKMGNNPKSFTSAGNYSGTMVKGKTSKSWKVLKIILLIVGIIAVIASIIWYNTDPDAKEKLGNILFGFVVMAIFGTVIWRKSRKGLIMSSKERQANYNWNDNFEPDVDSDDDNDD